MGYHFKNTKRGYDYWESLSALQKYCRRGNAREALWIFLELESSGYFVHAINRLEVIMYEDVGLANKEMFYGGHLLIERAKKSYKEKKEMWILIISSLIQEISESEKSRTAGEFFSDVCKYRYDVKKIDFPDYVFDQHTRVGKSKGRGLKHFFDEASKLIPQSDKCSKYKKSGEDAWLFFEKLGSDGLEESRKEPGLLD